MIRNVASISSPGATEIVAFVMPGLVMPGFVIPGLVMPGLMKTGSMMLATTTSCVLTLRSQPIAVGVVYRRWRMS